MKYFEKTAFIHFTPEMMDFIRSIYPEMKRIEPAMHASVNQATYKAKEFLKKKGLNIPSTNIKKPKIMQEVLDAYQEAPEAYKTLSRAAGELVAISVPYAGSAETAAGLVASGPLLYKKTKNLLKKLNGNNISNMPSRADSHVDMLRKSPYLI
jgi:hypothetical protein